MPMRALIFRESEEECLLYLVPSMANLQCGRGDQARTADRRPAEADRAGPEHPAGAGVARANHSDERRPLRQGRVDAPGGVSKASVQRRQRRHVEAGSDGSAHNELRKSGLPAPPAATVERVVAPSLAEPPGQGTYWTVGAVAADSGISLSSVATLTL